MFSKCLFGKECFCFIEGVCMTRSILTVLLLVFLFLGCTPSTKETSVLKLDQGASVIDYSTARRGAYVRPDVGNPKRILVCAEPPPDIAVGLTTDLTATLNLSETIKPELGANIAEEVIDLAKRGQALQIQREALYRLCELHANGVLEDKQVIKMYREVINTVKLVALAEQGQAAAEIIKAFNVTPSSLKTAEAFPEAAAAPDAATPLIDQANAKDLMDFLKEFFEP